MSLRSQNLPSSTARRGNQIRDVCPKPGRTTSTRPELIRVTEISTPEANARHVGCVRISRARVQRASGGGDCAAEV